MGEHLDAALEEFALPYIGSPLHIHFDPSKHPRGRSARFIDVLGKLERAEHGSTVTLPHGIKVRRDLHGLQVEGGGHKPVELEHHHAVAAEALFRHTIASNQGHKELIDDLHHARRQAAPTHGGEALHLAERMRQTRVHARQNRSSYLAMLSPALFEKGHGGRVYAADGTHARVEGVLGTVQQRANQNATVTSGTDEFTGRHPDAARYELERHRHVLRPDQAGGRRNESTLDRHEASKNEKVSAELGAAQEGRPWAVARDSDTGKRFVGPAAQLEPHHEVLHQTGRKNEPTLPPDRAYRGNDANDYLSRKDDENEFGDPESDDPIEQWLTKERQMGRLNQPTLSPEHQAFVDATRQQLWDMDGSDARKLDDEDLGNALEILGPEEFKRWMVEKAPGQRFGIPWLANVTVK